jgi:hypothetical protein
MQTSAVESTSPADAAPAPREIRYTLYLSPEELATLRARAARTTTPAVSTYVREAALGRTPPAAIPAVNHATYRELVRLGTNLNQIAHHLNSGNVVTPDLGRRLSGELAHVAEQVRRLRLELATAR